MISFFVTGKPIQEGNITPWGTHRENKDGRLDAWRNAVKVMAREAMTGKQRINSGPVRLTVSFKMPRPKKLPRDRRGWPCVRPDLDKLVRAIGDALQGIVFVDDAQVCEVNASKHYASVGEVGDAWVKVEALDDAESPFG